MGLGKTLQSICILASKHHERAERHKATKSPDSVHLPSLIICPPTLTGHWMQEISTYATNLRPVAYTGGRSERERLMKSLKKYDAVITSYEVVRNDIEILGKVDWNYCILDEGHIIKNGKTKLTKAVKQLTSIHRLILSGTPIQNNVLELWSLFDFLMPGFLGSEKAFNDRFGKPIASSRDAKSSSKEQAAGALALEALHKQVLPFLLRRLKEDVLDDLPPKIIQDYYCELSPLQKQLYDDFSNSQARHDVNDQVAGGGTPAKGQHVFQALQYLRKLVNHPVLVLKPELPQHQAVVAKVEASGSTLRNISHAPKLQALQSVHFVFATESSLTVLRDQTNPARLRDRYAALGRRRGSRSGLATSSTHFLSTQANARLDRERPLPTAHAERDVHANGWNDGAVEATRSRSDVQRGSVDRLFAFDDARRWIGVEFDRGRYGHLYRARLESDEGSASDGSSASAWTEKGRERLSTHYARNARGEDHGVSLVRCRCGGDDTDRVEGRLQRFKLNIASSVVTQQNSDLSSLGTDQILDLFNVSSTGAIPVETQTRAVGQKAILEGLGDLPPEEEYGELDLGAFSSSLGV